jgi:hypothetical protein
MRKHIFGFALFSLIFASFALVYAFFYAPSIPPQEAVKPPISQTETRNEKPYSCQLRRNKLSYEVLSSQFDWDKRELTSKVKIFWNGYGESPTQIFAKIELFTIEENGFSESLEPMAFTKVFENRTEATLIIIRKLDEANKKLSKGQNLYIDFNFSENYPEVDYVKSSKNLSQAYQVLFIHGEKTK